jgi:Kinesin motor domain
VRRLHAFIARYMQGSNEGTRYIVCVSAVEIYNETVKDLLASSEPCEVITDQNERVTIRHKDKGALVERQVCSVAEAMHFIQPAVRSRATRATKCGLQLQGGAAPCRGVVLKLFS